MKYRGISPRLPYITIGGRAPLEAKDGDIWAPGGSGSTAISYVRKNGQWVERP